MAICALCRNEVTTEDGRSISDGGRTLVVHASCFADFSVLTREALRESGATTPLTGLNRLSRVVNGKLILTHRQFPNDQIPLLIYIAHKDQAVVVSDVYTWLRQNEMSIKNPSLQVHRLREKGLVATFDEDGTRWIVINDEGKRALQEFAESLG